MILMPLTFSITVGIGAGFISWVFIKVVVGKWRRDPSADVAGRRLPSLLYFLTADPASIRPQSASPPTAGQAAAEAAAECTAAAPGRPGPGRVAFGRVQPRFERTALPDGPRVISARMPGSRSLSVAVYVLAGSRLETPARRGRGALHGARHLQGTRATIPAPRAVSEAIEGCGGSCNAATDRESTVYWARVPVREAERAFAVLSELVVRPLLRDADIARERDIIVDEIRSYRDDPGQYVFNLFDRAFFGDTPLGWEIAGDEESVTRLTDRADPRLLVGRLPARRTWSSPSPAISTTRPSSTWSARPSAPATATLPSFAPAPAAPVERFTVEERDSCAGASLPGPAGAAARRSRPVGARAAQQASSARAQAAACSRRCARKPALAYDVTASRPTSPTCGTLQVYAGVDPDDLDAGARRRSSTELRRLRDEPVPTDELERARAYAAGRLELRLEETRHLSAWLGVQEALHERVLTLDEVLAELERGDAGRSSRRSPSGSSATMRCASRVISHRARTRGRRARA